jgi:hypothetical protein
LSNDNFTGRSKIKQNRRQQAETQHWLDTSLKCGCISIEKYGVLLQECKKIGKMMNQPETFCGKIGDK